MVQKFLKSKLLIKGISYFCKDRGPTSTDAASSEEIWSVTNILAKSHVTFNRWEY